MAIKKLSNTTSVEAIDYEFAFMDKMEIIQQTLNTDDDIPKYDVRITYRMYGVDSKKDIHYKQRTDTITVEDFVTYAMTLLNDSGDASLLQAMEVIQGVVATIISKDTGIDTEVI